MAEVHRIRTIAATRQEIWDVLADFGSIASWAQAVDHSSVLSHGPDGGQLGTTRRLQIGRITLVERIIEFDAPHTLAYDIEGLPKPVRKMTNRWRVRPSPGGSSVVTLTTTLEIGQNPVQNLAERAMCRVLARQSDGLLAGLAHKVEDSRV